MPRSSSSHGEKSWPFVPLGRTAVLTIGVVLLALCLFPFWGAIATAAVFAFGLKRPLERLRGRFGLGRPLMGAIATMAFLLAFSFPVVVAGFRLYQIAADQKGKGVSGAFSSSTVAQASEAYRRMEERIGEFGARWKLFSSEAEALRNLRGAVSEAVSSVLNTISGALFTLPELIVTGVVFSLFLYLFLARGSALGTELCRLELMRARDVSRISRIMQTNCYNAIVSSVIVGAVQATAIAAGARIFGFQESVLIFTAVFLLSFIPFIGAAPTAFALAIVAFLAGQHGNGIGMIVVGVIGGTIDNFLRPYLVSNAGTHVHPVVTFAAILGAIAVLGIKGLILGPVILTTTWQLVTGDEKA